MTQDQAALPAGPELDVLVAETVMGVNLVPPREAAMAHAAWNHIACTGPVFELRDGRKFHMPPGRELKQPEGCDDWNARYALYIAQQVGGEWEHEIAAVRDKPKPYSTDIAAAWEVFEKIPGLPGYDSVAIEHYKGRYAVIRQDSVYTYIGGLGGAPEFSTLAEADTAPLAICRAALAAIGMTV